MQLLKIGKTTIPQSDPQFCAVSTTNHLRSRTTRVASDNILRTLEPEIMSHNSCLIALQSRWRHLLFLGNSPASGTGKQNIIQTALLFSASFDNKNGTIDFTERPLCNWILMVGCYPKMSCFSFVNSSNLSKYLRGIGLLEDQPFRSISFPQTASIHVHLQWVSSCFSVFPLHFPLYMGIFL